MSASNDESDFSNDEAGSSSTDSSEGHVNPPHSGLPIVSRPVAKQAAPIDPETIITEIESASSFQMSEELSLLASNDYFHDDSAAKMIERNKRRRMKYSENKASERVKSNERYAKAAVQKREKRRAKRNENLVAANARQRAIRGVAENRELANARQRAIRGVAENREVANALRRELRDIDDNREVANARQRELRDVPENREVANALRRDRRGAAHHQTLESKWTQECTHGCGYMHLDSSVAGQLLNCCHGGRLCALHDDPLLQKFQLQPMSASMSTIMVDGIKTFGQLSSTYNNIVALCATGVKNDHGGGFERRVGNHAVTLNGRTYHYVPRAEAGTRPSGGMSYFVFDHTAAEAIRMHVLNRIPRTQQHADVVANDHIIVDANGPPVIPLPASNVVQNNSSIPLLNTDIAMALRNELLAINPYCKELQFVGSIINEMDARQAPISAEVVNASLRNAVQYFDVAHLTEDRATGERVVRFNTVAGRNGEVDMDSLHVEPMTYPLLFMHGERGWSKQDESDIPYNRYLSSRLLMPELKSFRADPYTAGLHFLTVEHATDFVEIVSTYTFFK